MSTILPALRTALLLLYHLACRKLAGVKDAELADGDRALDAGPIRLNNRFTYRDRGIGDGYVNSPKMLYGSGNHCLHRTAIGNICAPEEHAATEGNDGISNFLGFLGMGTIVDNNIGPVCGKAECDTTPIPREAPVTSAIRPSKRFVIRSLSNEGE